MRNPVCGRSALTIAVLLACGGLFVTRAVAQDRARDGGKPYVFRRAVALCIGIDKYRFVNEVKFAEADATAVGESFRRYYGFTPSYLIGPRATKRAILDTIRSYTTPQLGNGVANPDFLGEQDVLVIFFAGHGQVIPVPLDPQKPAGREGFLVPYDARLPADLKDFRDPEQWGREAIDMRELVRLVEGMKVQHVLVLADACCSGFMTQRGSKLSSRYDLQLLLTGRSRAVLAATTDRQGATGDEGHGYFTAALLGQLKGWSDRAEAASLTDVFEQVRVEVSKNSRGGMLPQMNPRIGEGDGEFVFLPKSLRQPDVEYAVRHAATLRDRPASGPGRGHILVGVLERAAERENRKTRVKEVIEAFQAGSYRFSTDFVAKDRYWRKQFEAFFNNATAGDVLAMAGLHYCYATGLGTEKENAAAYRWARDAFESEQPAGKHVLGRCLVNGIGVDKNQEAGMKLIGEAAKTGFPISLVSVSQAAVREGIAAKDRGRLAEAKRLLERAVEANVDLARVHLSYFYAGTLPGTTRDIDEAIRLLRPAAERGLPLAQYDLFKVYARAEDRKDPAEAGKWLQRAAEAGNPDAQLELAYEHYRGFPGDSMPTVLALPQNLEQAFRWAERAANQGNAGGHMLLCGMYEKGRGVEKNDERAIFHCNEAAKLNDPRAFYALGVWYQNGRLVGAQDLGKAKVYYERAANHAVPNPLACLNLGRMYESGSIRGPHFDNIPEMAHWFTRAAKLGSETAKDELPRVYRECLQNEPGWWATFSRLYPDSAGDLKRMLDLEPEKPWEGPRKKLADQPKPVPLDRPVFERKPGTIALVADGEGASKDVATKAARRAAVWDVLKRIAAEGDLRAHEDAIKARFIDRADDFIEMDRPFAWDGAGRVRVLAVVKRDELAARLSAVGVSMKSSSGGLFAKDLAEKEEAELGAGLVRKLLEGAAPSIIEAGLAEDPTIKDGALRVSVRYRVNQKAYAEFAERLEIAFAYVGLVQRGYALGLEAEKGRDYYQPRALERNEPFYYYGFRNYAPEAVRKVTYDSAKAEEVFLGISCKPGRDQSNLVSEWRYVVLPTAAADAISREGSRGRGLVVRFLDRDGKELHTAREAASEHAQLFGRLKVYYTPGQRDGSFALCVLPFFSLNENVFFLQTEYTKSLDLKVPEDILRQVHKVTVRLTEK